jgi:Ca2+/Na+ antiporter
MAAGASSPELFVSLIAVLKGSPVGVGMQRVCPTFVALALNENNA